MARIGLLTFLASFLAGGLVFGQSRPSGDFENFGMGGGGGMFCPTISPDDPKLMFVACDMSGVYRSTDAGQTWSLLHLQQLRSALNCLPTFAGGRMYWASMAQLRVSKDGGANWSQVVEGPQPWKNSAITHLAAGDGAKAALLVGTADGVWLSADGGKQFRQVFQDKCGGLLALGGLLYVATAGSLHHSADGGATWAELAIPDAKGKTATSIAGGQSGADDRVLYVIAAEAGTLLSRDGGKSWKLSQEWAGQTAVMMPPGQTKVAWSAVYGGQKVFRTADGGASWRNAFDPKSNVELTWVQKHLHWGHRIMSPGLGVDPRNPEVAMITTVCDFYVTRDGGKTWQNRMNEPVPMPEGESGFRCRTIGLEVTSVWDYVFDPNDCDRRYICYTDIGLARSEDGGKTYMSSVQGNPWHSNCYELAFDPKRPGRVFAASSLTHDIPHWNHVGPIDPKYGGGVTVSDNYGKTWSRLGTGLPKVPCTGIVVDPKSPKDALVLYATMFEDGVYKSTDDGATWNRKSRGLFHEGNNHCLRVRIAPTSGNLYCVVTAMRQGFKFPAPGGLWKSTDGGENWSELTADLKLAWPTDVAIDPRDEKVLYLTAVTCPEHDQGGLYKSTDGGKTWAWILKSQMLDGFIGGNHVEAMAVRLHPDKPDIVYVATGGRGLWVSQDAGKAWQPFRTLPFGGPQNITFDGDDRTIMYVSTFGAGVWKGRYLPAGEPATRP